MTTVLKRALDLLAWTGDQADRIICQITGGHDYGPPNMDGQQTCADCRLPK